MSAIKSAKAAVRKELAAIINKVSAEEKQRQSNAIFAKLINMKQYKESQRISVYLSTPDEVDTQPILKHIFENGKLAFVPRYKGKTMEMVKLDSMADYEKLPLTKWNIKQPDSKDVRDNALETGGLDLIILPGVAFTKGGDRLGHGMGYYDKYLLQCFASQKQKPYTIAIAFNEQVKDKIPLAETDVTLDMILTSRLN